MKKNKPLFITKHQLKRMAKRGISKAIIQAVVEYGAWGEGNAPFSHIVEYKGVIVILYSQKSQYNVSSCKLNRKYTKKAEELSKNNKIDFWKACHQVVKSIDFKDDIKRIGEEYAKR
ncbi:hypothetical protein PQE66_gp070 [Bacillus phage PBC2]|uniref:Uncharacterized protein n=1 Tax=Bacillus phage PBC2 TaxID=1675029 RepID=A0A218KBW1_9CAUD|nr:hypothetical protein PQE66_gp070 [Bacillus phage PBC2]AKQ08385.1 hypothetical protein PBC2_070 [Bacillus phage PBC2]